MLDKPRRAIIKKLMLDPDFWERIKHQHSRLVPLGADKSELRFMVAMLANSVQQLEQEEHSSDLVVSPDKAPPPAKISESLEAFKRRLGNG